jgi:UDP-2,3-diacylglucosamine hydrolase
VDHTIQPWFINYILMTILFISDLHLSQERPFTGELFLSFLNEQAGNVETLYILGDLFEAWLGDDLVLPEYKPYLEALRQLSDSGVYLYIMHGNRDFLIAHNFEELTGASLLPDPTTIDLYGHPTLLMHGDTLCTDDLAYQELRKMVRNPEWISQFLNKTPGERITFARELREKSREATTQKDKMIMDVNQLAVEETFRTHEVEWIIHGHTHRQAIHDLDIDGKQCKRMVLGDWYESGNLLRCDESGCRLEEWNL